MEQIPDGETQATSTETLRATFGQLMQDARVRSGCTVADLSQATRISRNFIEALEAGQFATIPGEAFGRGFVRSICKALGHDSAPLVEAFNAAWGHNAENANPDLNVPLARRDVHSGLRKRPDRKGLGNLFNAVTPGVLWGIGSAAIVIVGIVLWSVRGSDDKQKVASVKPPAKEVVHAADKTAVDSGMAGNPALAVNPAGEAEATVEKKEPATAAAVVPPPAAPAPAAAPATPESVEIASAPGATSEQVIAIDVHTPVSIKMRIDKGQYKNVDYTPDKYTIKFKDKAELLISDAAAVDIAFNGKAIGSLGSKGRMRKISFRALENEVKKF